MLTDCTNNIKKILIGSICLESTLNISIPSTVHTKASSTSSHCQLCTYNFSPGMCYAVCFAGPLHFVVLSLLQIQFYGINMQYFSAGMFGKFAKSVTQSVHLKFPDLFLIVPLLFRVFTSFVRTSHLPQ